MEKIPEKKAVKRKSRKEIRVSSSGRQIMTPKHLQTSSDEQPPVKKGASSKNLKAEIERLKGYVAVMEKQKVEEKGAKKRGNESKVLENKDSGNTDVYSTSHRSDDPIDPSSPNTLEPVEVKIKNQSVLKTKGTKSSPPSEKAAAILKKINTEYVDVSNNESSAIVRLEIPPPEISQNRKTGGNLSLTQEMRSPPSRKDETIQSGCDEVFGEIVPKSFQKNVEEQLENLRKTNETLVQQNKQILDMLHNQLSIGGGKLSKTLYEPLKGFPITKVEEFNELEDDTRKEARRKVYDYLVCLGGSTLRGFLLGGLQIIMTDELVCQFTWNGDAKTEKLGDTKVSNVLYQAAKNCPLFQGPDNKNTYKTEMLQVLKTTKKRFRNSQKNKVINTNRDQTKETTESIQKRISKLQEMLLENSDADDEEDDSLQSDHLDDEDIEDFE